MRKNRINHLQALFFKIKTKLSHLKTTLSIDSNKNCNSAYKLIIIKLNKFFHQFGNIKMEVVEIITQLNES
jgi:hypothetical protein